MLKRMKLRKKESRKCDKKKQVGKKTLEIIQMWVSSNQLELIKNYVKKWEIKKAGKKSYEILIFQMPEKWYSEQVG